MDELFAQQLLKISSEYPLPIFVYDADTITHQVKNLQQAFDVAHLEIRYASKALNTIAVLSHIYHQGCGIDTVSPGEITMALRAGVPPEKISFTPSGVNYEEYAFAIQHGVHIHVDQIHVLSWLDHHYPGTSITLRFNPGIQAGGHPKLQVGSKGSKFGFISDQLEELKLLIRQCSLKVTGVHMHLGSDISDTRSFDLAYEFLLAAAHLWSDTLTHVDLGGGFKVQYHHEDEAIDMMAFGKNVSERFARFCAEIKRNLTLVLEPGKYLVSAAGYLLMGVTGLRHAGDIPMVFVQSGFNHFVRPMNYGAYHHIINLSNPGGQVHHYNIVGYLCETDTFALQRPVSEIRQGDVLCLMNAGAYGYTMASNYNGRTRPAEVLIKNGKTSMIRRAETIDDLLATDLGLID